MFFRVYFMSYRSKSAFFSKSLFERLVDSTVHRQILEEPRIEDVVDSIKYNLKNILNSRIGHSQSAPDLGLVDFNDATITSSDVSTQIKQTIAQCILRYEPRIRDVIVQLYSNPDSPMSFEIRVTAFIQLEDVKQQVTIDILCDSNKYYKVY